MDVSCVCKSKNKFVFSSYLCIVNSICYYTRREKKKHPLLFFVNKMYFEFYFIVKYFKYKHNLFFLMYIIKLLGIKLS